MEDLVRRVGRLEDGVKELNSDMKFVRAELAEIKGMVRGVEGRLTGMEGRFTSMEGRFGSIEGRFSQIPNATQIILFVLAIFTLSGMTQWLVRPDLRPPAVTSSAPR